jgi:hypothetical protein
MYSENAVRFTTLNSDRAFTLLALPIGVLRHKSRQSRGGAHTSEKLESQTRGGVQEGYLTISRLGGRDHNLGARAAPHTQRRNDHVEESLEG